MSVFSENKTAEKRLRSGLEYPLIKYEFKLNTELKNNPKFRKAKCLLSQ